MTDRALPGDKWPQTELYDVFHRHWGHPEAWWSYSKQGGRGSRWCCSRDEVQ